MSCPRSPSSLVSKLRHPVVIAVGGLLSTGLAWLALGSDDVASATDAREAQTRTNLVDRARIVASASGRVCSFEPSTTMAYDVVSETIVEIDMGRLSEGVDVDTAQGQVQVGATPAQRHEVLRNWHLELVAVARDDDGSTLLAARIEDRGTQANVGNPTVSAALSDTFLIRVDARCGIREFGWRTEGDLDGAREQQLLAAGLGFAAPSDASEARSYGATSFDATGRYIAKYQYEDGQLSGEAVSYALGSADARGVPIAVEILASTIEVELAADAWFESLNNEHDLEFAFHGKPFATHFRSTTARRVLAGQFSPNVDLHDGGWSFGRLAAKPRDSSLDYDEELRDVPLDAALARYRELVATGRIGDYGTHLRDWLRANPEQTGELLALLRAGEFEGEQAARAGLFYALGSANTEQAKGALIDILREWPNAGHQIAAAHAIAMVEQPSAEMIELVAAGFHREDLESIERGSMALALGTVASTSELNSPEIAAAAREEIRGWLAAPSDDEQLGHALAAAGNAGHDELAADIGIYLDHESPAVRKHAAKAMRQMSPAQVYPQLEQALADEDRVVRTTALETAATVARRSDRPPSEAIVGLAATSLASEAQAEQRAAVALLGEAARRGDDQADALLHEHLGELLQSEQRDRDRIAALGRSMPSHWKAAD